MSNNADNYIFDLGAILRREALDAKGRANREIGLAGHQFALGRLTAFYEVLSLMQQQANAFGIEARQLSLDGFDADRDLLADGSNKND
jgi:hypothetical protein